jgi:hypothetical protein
MPSSSVAARNQFVNLGRRESLVGVRSLARVTEGPEGGCWPHGHCPCHVKAGLESRVWLVVGGEVV